MSRVKGFLIGAWEFVVGDDWRTAFGVMLALAVTALVADAAVSAWWVMPLATIALLALSLRRAARAVARSGGQRADASAREGATLPAATRPRTAKR